MNDESIQPVEIDLTLLAEQALEDHQNKDTYIVLDPENGTESVHPYFYWDAAAAVISRIIEESGIDPIDLFKRLKDQGGYEDKPWKFSSISSGAVEEYGTFGEMFLNFSRDALSLKMVEMNPNVYDLDEEKRRIAGTNNPTYFEDS